MALLAVLLLCIQLLLAQASPSSLCKVCDMLGKDNIQGKKSGFLAGNKVYYSGGTVLAQELYENETIGLTHPFFHDLRSRGTGIASYQGVGTGNDFSGWEFYRGTRVAYGTVVTPEMRWENPAPTNMYWMPDKMVVEYQLTNPYLQGEFEGWCQNWKEGTVPELINLTKSGCWSACNADPACRQAVFESSSTGSQCWLGINQMTADQKPSIIRRPGCNLGTCSDMCFAKGAVVPPVNISEHKFISNEVVSTIIAASRPIVLEITGNSFDAHAGSGQVVSLNGQCSVDVQSNSIHIREAGVVQAQVSQNPNVFKQGRLMYDGMSGVISASHDLQSVSMYNVSDGVCGYTFQLPVGNESTTLSWTMAGDYATALKAVQRVLDAPEQQMVEKTQHMDQLLSDVVPYFNCSDPDVVKIYYFLWSIYLMYFTEGGSGMQTLPHTQTAFNNFLGMHRYDAVFQIMVGSWTSPGVHPLFANGNVLSWSELLRFRQKDQLPDNFGTEWASGCYGPETIGHVIGAWQVYEHSGNRTFLAEAYAFYKELFWEGIRGTLWTYAYDSVLCLNRMAEALGVHEDAVHWNATIGMADLDHTLSSQWDSTRKIFGAPGQQSEVTWGNIAPIGMSMFPRNWTIAMAHTWLDDPINGFSSGDVPLLCTARQFWPKVVDPNSAQYNFAVTPDANWYMLRGLYKQQVITLANKFTLAHLKKYNMEWGIPVAPETRRMNFDMHGDQYSNFNAGKILLILEGIGGIQYSAHDDSFSFADNMPSNWSFMEYRVPVQSPESDAVTWVTARAERHAADSGKVVKVVTVENNPFKKLVVQPWVEDSQVISSSPTGDKDSNPAVGHVGWVFEVSNATVTLELAK